MPLQEWELAALRRRFALPAAFADWAEDDDHAGEPDLPAEITTAGDQLVLAISGTHRFGLVASGGQRAQGASQGVAGDRECSQAALALKSALVIWS